MRAWERTQREAGTGRRLHISSFQPKKCDSKISEDISKQRPTEDPYPHTLLFSLPCTGQRKAPHRAGGPSRRDVGTAGSRRSKATIRGNIAQISNGAEIFPTENKFVRLQAGVWTICEQ